jgi:hypothetical protein
MMIEKSERHTEDITEIITKVPAWIVRWGIMLFFGILLTIIAISFFVRYPDLIKTSLKFESVESSKPVISTVSGIVMNTYAKQGELVKKGQVLATIEVNGASSFYDLSATQDGKLGFATIVQPGVILNANEIVFVIHPANENFFGVAELSPSQINKVKLGQLVLIKLKNIPEKNDSQIKGNIGYITDEPNQNGLFTIKITLNKMGSKKQLFLKDWMTGDAEIVTEDISLQRRIFNSIFKGLSP